jgi:hypothetical protein
VWIVVIFVPGWFNGSVDSSERIDLFFLHQKIKAPTITRIKIMARMKLVVIGAKDVECGSGGATLAQASSLSSHPVPKQSSCPLHI